MAWRGSSGRLHRWVPTDVVPAYPWALDRIVFRATRLDRQERYPSAEAMALALDELAESLDEPTGRPAVAAWVAAHGQAEVDRAEAMVAETRTHPFSNPIPEQRRPPEEGPRAAALD